MPSLVCDNHRVPLSGSPEQPEAPCPGYLCSALGLQLPYKSRALPPFSPRLGRAQRASQAPRGGGGEEEENLPPRRLEESLLGGFSGRSAPLFGSGFRRDGSAGAGEGAGEVNHRRRPGREANVHRVSGPTPGQVALQVGPVFTCLLSQVAQTRAPFLSSGAWGRPWCARVPSSLRPRTAV